MRITSTFLPFYRGRDARPGGSPTLSARMTGNMRDYQVRRFLNNIATPKRRYPSDSRARVDGALPPFPLAKAVVFGAGLCGTPGERWFVYHFCLDFIEERIPAFS
jgi:hypothetical protein